MAAVPKRLYKGLATTTATNVYPVPTGAITMVKAVTLCNTTSAVATFKMSLGGTSVIFDHQIKANDTVTIPFLDQIMSAGEAIQISCTPSNAISVYISGKEVT
ncbi:hypothetical protein B2I21_08680 [Chryseobacterium mucoviscidosis]|nr:hypothetical protein B2I21_08680 [Chryseobacterium mucoviscidosis]